MGKSPLLQPCQYFPYRVLPQLWGFSFCVLREVVKILLGQKNCHKMSNYFLQLCDYILSPGLKKERSFTFGSSEEKPLIEIQNLEPMFITIKYKMFCLREEVHCT